MKTWNPSPACPKTDGMNVALVVKHWWKVLNITMLNADMNQYNDVNGLEKNKVTSNINVHAYCM